MGRGHNNSQWSEKTFTYYDPAPRVGALSDDARLTSVCRVHRAKSKTERLRKTKIGTEVAHVTRDSDTTFKVKGSKVNLQGAGYIVAASRTAYQYIECVY